MNDTNRIFLSWSGDTSGELAEILKEWLSTVFDDLDVCCISRDIGPGQRWSKAIDDYLQNSHVGIFVYTPDNYDSLWMAFEAGALSKKIAESRIVPLVFGGNVSDLQGPIARFQAKRFGQKEMVAVLNTVNEALQLGALPALLDKKVIQTWDWLSPKIAEILNKANESGVGSSSRLRQTGDILDDIYSLLRESPLNDKGLAKDVTELVQQMKTTHRGTYLFIDGEKPAFSALIAATMRGRKHIRSTRFFPHAISGNQESYGRAIHSRVVGNASEGIEPVSQYSRIISTNNRAKLNDIDGYFRDFKGHAFNLYLTNRPHSFELVIIDDEEVFVHFYGKGQVINSTLHIVGTAVTRHFVAIYERIHDPNYDPSLFKIEFKYVKDDSVSALRDRIEPMFPPD